MAAELVVDVFGLLREKRHPNPGARMLLRGPAESERGKPVFVNQPSRGLKTVQQKALR